jgi:hypothetical protein
MPFCARCSTPVARSTKTLAALCATLCATALTLAGCGSPPSALQLARAHPNSQKAAEYVTIRAADLPPTYTERPVPENIESKDAAETLAEYSCERLAPPTGPSPISAKTPDFLDQTGETELHETTDIFRTPAVAAQHLTLQQSPLYPSCKAAAFKSALVASAPVGERVGFVSVHVNKLPAQFGVLGVEVVGLSTLDLPDGITSTATSDLAVLIRGPMVAELSIETDGPAPNALLTRLTSDLADRMRQIVPKSSRH